MLYLNECGVGNVILLFANSDGNLADYTRTTSYTVKATYLGYYPNSKDSSDQCLIGWKEEGSVYSTAKTPIAFALTPQVINPKDYKLFRWCGKGRYVSEDLGPDAIGPTVPSTEQLKPGQLSPIHAPGWHQCKCGFRNQDISITAVIAGKYVCYQCRNIWKK